MMWTLWELCEPSELRRQGLMDEGVVQNKTMQEKCDGCFFDFKNNVLELLQ